MSTQPLDIEKAHRWFAVEYNNATWELLSRTPRSSEEDDQMVHAAHASLIHWKQAGTAIHVLRARYLLTNVYAAIGDGHSAVRYGEQVLQAQAEQPEGMEDWDTPFIYDAVARAYAAAGQKEKAIDYKEQARTAGENLAGEEDRKIFIETFQSGNWHGIE